MPTLDAVATTLKLAEPLTTVFSLLAAILAGIAAWLSYRLAHGIRQELKADEVLVAGVLEHPRLAHPDHENCVLLTTAFNKSKRKCVISKVKVFDGKCAEIDVDWADRLGPVAATANYSDVFPSLWKVAKAWKKLRLCC